MKVYRGPKTKNLVDDSHELVDDKEIGNVKPWTSQIDVKVEIAKDSLAERRSLVTLRFNESDIEGLYQALIEGRQNQSRVLEKMRQELSDFEDVLERIKRLAAIGKIKYKNDSFEEITIAVKTALGEI